MKKLLAVLVALMLTLGMTGCNYSGYDLIDTNHHFNRAIVKMPDGEVVEMKIAKWAGSGCELTLTDAEGNRYLVHAANCILIEDN